MATRLIRSDGGWIVEGDTEDDLVRGVNVIERSIKTNEAKTHDRRSVTSEPTQKPQQIDGEEAAEKTEPKASVAAIRGGTAKMAWTAIGSITGPFTWKDVLKKIQEDFPEANVQEGSVRQAVSRMVDLEHLKIVSSGKGRSPAQFVRI